MPFTTPLLSSKHLNQRKGIKTVQKNKTKQKHICWSFIVSEDLYLYPSHILLQLLFLKVGFSLKVNFKSWLQKKLFNISTCISQKMFQFIERVEISCHNRAFYYRLNSKTKHRNNRTIFFKHHIKPL